MIEVTVFTDEKQHKVSFSEPVSLSQALAEAGLLLDKPCGGNGTCGKCRVRAEGCLSLVSETEAKTLGENALKEGFRLACLTMAEGPAQIYFIMQNTVIQGVTQGHVADYRREPLTGDKECRGLAVDIGTTTIAAYLYSLPEGRLERAVCVKNNQAAYGADVISRIEAAGEGKLSELTKTIREQLRELVQEQLKASPEVCVITGNTTMLHLLTGLDPSGIAVSPFTPQSLFGEWHGNTYLPKCMSAYVGADITTAVLASGLTSYHTAFLVDVGTNGEMALWHDGKLWGCSTAAGPAFEGAGISMGMTAREGAVSHVWLEEAAEEKGGKRLCFETIKNAPACGICGTGLIDLVACLLELGLIDETGYLEEDYVLPGTEVFLSLQDVRQVQLAKSAICSGIETLLVQAGISGNELEAFCIAGGFGSMIDVNTAAAIGLIPKEVLPAARAVGNAAGMGAGMLLQSRKVLEESERLAEEAHILELSANPFFMEKYIENMMFQMEEPERL